MSAAIGRAIYTLLLLLLVPVASLGLAWRSRSPGAARARWRERFGLGPEPRQDIATWVHAASVGEVQAAAPLVDALLALHGDGRIALTTVTATGSAQAQTLWGERVAHSYLPFDLPFAVNNFLRRTQPRQAIILEAELWPNLFAALAARKIPLTLANARMSPRSFARFQRLRGLIAPTLARISTVAAQSPADAERYRQLGAARVTAIGNLKFECRIPQPQLDAGRALRLRLGLQRPVWVAASTHKPEEAAALAAHQTLLLTHPDALLILVPRHPQRFASVWSLVAASALRGARRSDAPPDPQTQVLLGDSLGEMFVYLAAADVAFVGGSLVPVGGHNVLEPAALGLPVVHGPHMHNFIASRDLLGAADAAIEIAAPPELGAALVELFDKPQLARQRGARGKAALAGHQGAVARLLRLL